MWKGGRLAYLCLLLAVGACESRQAKYERLDTDLTIARLRQQRAERLAGELSDQCGLASTDTACARLPALLDTLKRAEFQLSEAERAMRRFEQ